MFDESWGAIVIESDLNYTADDKRIDEAVGKLGMYVRWMIMVMLWWMQMMRQDWPILAGTNIKHKMVHRYAGGTQDEQSEWGDKRCSGVISSLYIM